MRLIPNRVDLRVAAAVAEATMLTYFMFQNYVDLSTWNNLADSESQLPSTLMGLVPGTAVVVATLRGGRRSARAAIVWVWIWVGMQITQWWIPYLFGVNPLTQDGGQWYVDGDYARTFQLLHTEEGRVVPDAQHLTLHTLSILAAVLVSRALRDRAHLAPVKQQRTAECPVVS